MRRRLGIVGLIVAVAIVAGAVLAWAQTTPANVPLARVAPLTTASVPGSSDHPSSRAAGSSAPARLHPAVALASIGADPAVSPLRPVSISIPYLHVDARVLPEPAGPGGSLVIPAPKDVGWFDAGPAPGQAGTTVIAGHIDLFGVDGAFLRLSELPVGAKVFVTCANGAEHVYVVSRRLLLSQQRLAASGLLRSRGPERLVLLSCGGAYDAQTHLYLQNVVVVARPVASR
jgi:hypothetical protein